MNTDINDRGGLATIESKPSPNKKNAQAQQPADTAWEDGDAEPTGFKKWRVPLTVAVVSLTLIGYVAKTLSSKSIGGVGKVEKPTEITIVPFQKPIPPPPPPPQQVVKEEAMIKQEVEKQEEPEQAPDVATAIKGSAGPGSVTFARQQTGNFFGKRQEGGKTKWGWYATQVQTTVADVLKKNATTKKANGQIEVRIKVDRSTGRIIGATLGSSTGDSAMDAAIVQALKGAQLQQPPPEEMPMPIVLRVTARRQG